MKFVLCILAVLMSLFTLFGISQTVSEQDTTYLAMDLACAALSFALWKEVCPKEGKKTRKRKVLESTAAPAATLSPAPVIQMLSDDEPAEKLAPKSMPSTTKSVKCGNAVSKQIGLDFQSANSIRQRFIAFDVETTGLQPASDRIVEIGAVLFLDGKPKKAFSSLVNPGIPMSAEASRVNHITDDMLATAPTEREIYPKLIDFLGDALQGQIIMCAHNAGFDFTFLCGTLSRLGFDASIQYMDTLGIAKKYLHGLENYKQGTIEAHYGLVSAASHRAASDAENCGHILCRLLDAAKDDLKEERQKIKKIKPKEQELEVCAYVQQMIAEKGGDTALLRYKKTSSGHVDMCCLYPFLRMKFGQKGRYILARKEWVLPDGVRTKACSQSEGGTDFIRMYFSSPFDLSPLSEQIYQAYTAERSSMESYVSHSSQARREAEKCMRLMYTLSDEAADALLKAASEHDYAPVSTSISSEPSITRDDGVMNADHPRVPLSEIKNLNDRSKGYDQGSPYWVKGENARKAGEFVKAIKLFDKARYYGYEAPALYDSYAIAYRQLKDYSNEIRILDEGIARMPEKASRWEARRERAIKLLFTQQEKDRTAAEKTKLKAKRQHKKSAAVTEDK